MEALDAVGIPDLIRGVEADEDPLVLPALGAVDSAS
jgi:hypothetical protein